MSLEPEQQPQLGHPVLPMERAGMGWGSRGLLAAEGPRFIMGDPASGLLA